jgi:hypothetical protein
MASKHVITRLQDPMTSVRSVKLIDQSLFMRRILKLMSFKINELMVALYQRPTAS